MNTAQNIIVKHNLQAGQVQSFANCQAAETDARDKAIKTAAPNCFDRTWTFYDGSKLVKTRDGLDAT